MAKVEMMLIATVCLAWYVIGLLIVRFIQPFWPTCDIMLLAPFWPLLLWIEWRETRWFRKELDLMEERHRLEMTLMILVIGTAVIQAQETVSRKSKA